MQTELSTTPVSSGRIDWIDSLRVIFMFGVFMVHAVSGAEMGLYARAATYGYMMLAGYLFARPGVYVPLFLSKKVVQLLVIYIFWVLVLNGYFGLMAYMTDFRNGVSEDVMSYVLPAYNDFLYPYTSDGLVHLWWLKSYLLVMCVGGVLHRAKPVFLLLLSLFLMGLNDLYVFSEPVFLRPVVLAFFTMGMFLSRFPRMQIESMTGGYLSKTALFICSLFPWLILSAFRFDVVAYPPLHEYSLFVAIFILLLTLCSHCIAKCLPHIQKCFSLLAPGLMI